VTLLMKCAGTILPEPSLRWPVSISWLIRIFTLTTPSRSAARILIGSAISCSLVRSAAAAAERDLDFLLRHVELAVGLDQRVDVRTLADLHPGRDIGFGARGNVEARSKRVRILLDQQCDGFGAGQPALDRDRHD